MKEYAIDVRLGRGGRRGDHEPALYTEGGVG